MSKRVTIIIDDSIIKKLRIIQANQIRTSRKSISFSSIVNQQLQKSLK